MRSNGLGSILPLYRASYRLLRLSYNGLVGTYAFLRACFAGVWLGLLDREPLMTIADDFYRNHDRYQNDAYNTSGLWTWEKYVLEHYFKGAKRLVILGAGGGREVIALERMGFEVVGYECNLQLVEAANGLLERLGMTSRVRFAPPDECPPSDEPFDGLIVGWGAYMLIQGGERRIALLRSLRRQALPSSPLLLSYFVRQGDARRFRLSAAIANAFRRLRGRELVDVGDDLEPEYVHYFTTPEVADELTRGGFRLERDWAEPYGHAVATAV